QVPSWIDQVGHGTHVAGIAVGNGIVYGGAGRPASGVAFNAQLVVQTLWDSAGVMDSVIPLNLNALYEPVYDNNGVRIHNNSWARAPSPRYANRAYHTDQCVWRNPDLVVLRAAANAGVDVA